MSCRIFKSFDLGDGEKSYISISYSQLETFLQCPRKWMFKYLLNKGESVSTESTELGTQVHACLEEYCSSVQKGMRIEVAEAVQLMESKLNSRRIKFVENDEEIQQVHIDMIKNIVKRKSPLGKLLDECDVIGQEIEFKYLFELPFEIMFGKSKYKEVVINGFIDLVLQHKETGDIYVIDHKTSKKKFDAKKIRENLQLPIYSLVIKEMFGKLPKRTMYYFSRFDEIQETIPIVDTGKEKIIEYYKNKKVKNIGKDVQEINNILIDIFSQMYRPEKYGFNACALCSWCEFSKYYGDESCVDSYFYERKDKKTNKGRKPVVRKAWNNGKKYNRTRESNY